MSKYISHNLIRLSVLAFIVLLPACTPTTRIMGTWKTPDAGSKNYNRIVVAALTDNIRARETVESDMQAQFRARGVEATKSLDMFPPTASRQDGPDVDLLLDKVKTENYGGIMTIALIDEQTDTRYVPGTYAYTPITRFGWYGRFRGYYTYWYPTLYDPGYYTEEKIYFLETNLYDTDTENLIWSAQSRSYSPGSLRKASEKLAEITVSRMAQDGLIR